MIADVVWGENAMQVALIMIVRYRRIAPQCYGRH